MARIMLVFEDVGPPKALKESSGPRFNFYSEGLSHLKTKHPDTWTSAEYWGAKCFGILVSVLRQSGVVQTETPRSGD